MSNDEEESELKKITGPQDRRAFLKKVGIGTAIGVGAYALGRSGIGEAQSFSTPPTTGLLDSRFLSLIPQSSRPTGIPQGGVWLGTDEKLKMYNGVSDYYVDRQRGVNVADFSSVQAAITYAKSISPSTPFNGIDLYFPPGVTNLGPNPIDITGVYQIRFIGAHRDYSKLYNDQSLSSMIRLGDGLVAGNDFIGKIIIKDLWLDGHDANCDIIRQQNLATQPGNISIIRSQFWAFGTGYGYHDGVNGIFSEDGYVSDTKFAFGGTSINLNLPNWTFNSVTFDHLLKAITLYANSKATFIGGVFSTNENSVDFAAPGSEYANPIIFDGTWFENDSDATFVSENSGNTIDLILNACKINNDGTYHMYLPSTSSLITDIGCEWTFPANGPKVLPKIYIGDYSSTNIFKAINDRKMTHTGAITNPFNSTQKFVGPHCSTEDSYVAAPTSTQRYRAQFCEGLYIKTAGGTMTHQYLFDRTGTIFQDLGATAGMYYVPAGFLWEVDYSSAPTVTVVPT